jgi:hypothetical protein
MPVSPAYSSWPSASPSPCPAVRHRAFESLAIRISSQWRSQRAGLRLKFLQAPESRALAVDRQSFGHVHYLKPRKRVQRLRLTSRASVHTRPPAPGIYPSLDASALRSVNFREKSRGKPRTSDWPVANGRVRAGAGEGRRSKEIYAPRETRASFDRMENEESTQESTSERSL